MQTLMHVPAIFIDLSRGDELYPFFYRLAMFSGMLWLIYEGYRRKFNRVPWLLTLSTLMLFSVAGTKLSAWNADDFRLLIQEGIWPDLNKKSSIGGFAGGLLALLMCKRLFRFDDNFYDAFAFFPMIVMFIQRMGCLAAGCCFGTTCTQTGIGVEYFGSGSLRNLQLKDGIIQPWEWTTHLVHAVPVYLMLAALISAILVWRMSSVLRKPGSKALFGLICMAAGRFVIEFWRDSSTNHALGTQIYGLKVVQWVGLTILVFLTIWLIYNEKYYKKPLVSATNSTKDSLTSFYLAALAAFTYLLHPYFNHFEKAVVFAMLLAALAVNVRKALLQTHWSHRPMMPVALGLVSLVMMSQTFRYNEADSSRTSTVFKFNQTYRDMIIPEYPYCIREETTNGCAGSSTDCVLADSLRPLGEDYFQNNLSFETYFNSDRKVELMVGGGVNQDIFRNKSKSYSENFNQVFVELGVYGKKRFGMKTGVYAGNFAVTEKISAGRKSAYHSAVLPYTEIWLGNKDYFTLEAGSLFNSYANNVMGRSHLKMNANLYEGTGGKVGQLSVGYEIFNLENSRSRVYLSSEILLPNRWTVIPQFGYTTIDNDSYMANSGYTGGLGIRYDLNRKK